MKKIIMKFGGAALESPSHFSNVAEIIAEKKLHYDHLVVVVSAMGGVTDELMGLAHQVAKEPAEREMDMLLSVGERISMSLLAMALSDLGVEAISLTGSQSGIITSSRHREAEILTVRPQRINHHLERGEIVIVAGFQGVSAEREITTLGRGGSDTSAVALAIALAAEKVEFYKDVEGIYSQDPKKNPRAALLEKLTFEEALKFQNPLHSRSILLASKNNLPLHILSFKRDLREHFPGSWIEGSATKKEAVYEAALPK
ncbi:MAG: Aspartate kinase [Chlamydiae bacterium]|nr:Aspartate kinase [Chlamydiota bacterium]